MSTPQEMELALMPENSPFRLGIRRPNGSVIILEIEISTWWSYIEAKNHHAAHFTQFRNFPPGTTPQHEVQEQPYGHIALDELIGLAKVLVQHQGFSHEEAAAMTATLRLDVDGRTPVKEILATFRHIRQSIE